MNHKMDRNGTSGTATLEREIFTCPKCGKSQPVTAGTRHLINEGQVTVCCAPAIVAPAPGPAMPQNLRVMS